MIFNRFIIALLFCLLLVRPCFADFAQEQAAADPIKETFALLRQSNWLAAQKMAAQSRNPLLQKYVDWRYLKDDSTTALFSDLQNFLSQNPTWPGLKAIQAKAEYLLPPEWNNEQVLAWFSARPPVTLDGKLRIAAVYLQQNKKEEAVALLREYWRNASLSRDLEDKFYKTYRAHLTPSDHLWRIEDLVRAKDYTAARNTAKMLGKSYVALAEAKIAFVEGKKNARQLLQKVPKTMQNETGLLLDRITQKRRAEKYDEAALLLARQPKNMGPLAANFWKERDAAIRQAIKTKSFGKAYDLAAKHGQKEGVPLAEAEFLAGWLALQKMHRPDWAEKHFTALSQNAPTPIAAGRAYYWLGRTAEKQKSPAAQGWYTKAIAYPSTFYGQLARQRIPPQNFSLPVTPAVNVFAEEAFRRSEPAEVIQMLHNAGEKDAVDNWVNALSDSAATPEQMVLLIRLCQSLNRRDLAVTVARKARLKGTDLIEAGFPMLEIPGDKQTEQALVQALIRQESSFDSEARSPAGALGLMQLMPYVATAMAKRLGGAYKSSWLTERPEYNVTLGKMLLQEKIDSFTGSYPMAIAAYNAGESRVREWMESYGDPRGDKIDLIDWIESIPFSETRNYVHRVLENLVIYRYLLASKGS